jgi:predicted nucleotidyltransferase
MEELLGKLVDESRHIFGNNLVGIYLHGSMAMGCFHPRKSDLDVIFVVENSATDLQKKQFMQVIVDLNDQVPAKGIEMSLIRREYCNHFVYPTPFELHFSNIHLNWYKRNPTEYIEKMNGVDHDLAAHFVIIKSRGIVLYGKPIHDVFGEIPSEAYWDSIRRDIAHAEDEVFENPIYIILNLCRVLAYRQDGLVLSKKEGGKWGMENIATKYQGLIKEALVCYSSDQNMCLNHSLALEYCKYMKSKLGFGE